jgi:hypothetical protein
MPKNQKRNAPFALNTPKHTLFYYLALVFILICMFFSNDYGMLDVQKTAIVLAVGVDREDDTFILTSQIAVPESSKQGKATQTVELVSRGKTIADAFRQINAKTGWYPKLVFCKLIVLGEKTLEKNAMDALDFFSLDEYMSDNCLVACCDGLAKDILNTQALIDSAGSIAISKVLSTHAERVGTALPASLRQFCIGYFGKSKSGFLPIVQTQPQQEQVGGSGGSSGSGSSGNQSGGDSSSSGGGNQSSSGGDSSSSGGGSGGGSGGSAGSGGAEKQEKPVFSASRTALIVEGKRVGELTEEETFAVCAVKRELKLAGFSVQNEDGVCTLSIKNNAPSSKLQLGADGRATMQISLTLTAGLLDYSTARDLNDLTDAGDVPATVFPLAAKKLKAQISSAYEKCRSCGCDVFELNSLLFKKHPKRFEALQKNALQESVLEVNVHFENVR